MQRKLLIPAGLFLIFFTLYASTTVQGISTGDNAEFQLVTQQLGIAHPPGFPLYTILSYLFTQLPLPLSPVIRANLFPAVTSTATLIFIYYTVLCMTKSYLAGMGAAIIMGGIPTFWAQATVANIRSMTGLFAAIAFWSLLKMEKEKKDRWLIIFVLSISFGITHHLSLLFMGIVMGIWAISRFWDRPATLKWLSVSLLGLIPLLYLPWQSVDLRIWDNFISYVLGLGFESDFFYYITPTAIAARIGVMLNIFIFQFGSIGLMIGIVGLLTMMFSRPTISTLLIGSLAVHMFITATYRAPQTVEYMLPAYIPIAIGFGWICSRPSYHLLAILGIVLGCWQLATHWQSFHYLKTAAVSDNYIMPILQDAPRDIPILTNWHWYQSFLYQQKVNGVRLDVDIDYDPAPWEQRINEMGDQMAIVTDGMVGNALHHASTINGTADLSLPAFDLVLGDHITITHLDISAQTMTLDETVIVTIRWVGIDQPFTWFVHLGNGIPVVQDTADVQPNMNMVTLRIMPGIGTPIGEQAVWIGAFADTPFLDEAEMPRTKVGAITVIPSEFKPFTRNKTRIKDGERMLVGYDVDHTLAPRLYLHWQVADGYYSTVSTIDEAAVSPFGDKLTVSQDSYYVPLGHGIVWLGSEHKPISLSAGKQIHLKQRFVATRPITHDLAVSVQLTGQAPYRYWKVQDDGIPAMGGMPTLKWIAQSQINDPHWVTVPDDAEAGQQAVATVLLYDAFTQRPLPILDARINELGQGIPFLTMPIMP